MNQNSWEQYVQVTRKMNKLIHDIHNEIGSDDISQNVFKNIEELETVNRAHNAFCKEMKKNPTAYTEEQMNLMNKDIPFYRNTILNAKKLLIYYYNKLVYEIIKRRDSVREKIDKLTDNSGMLAILDGIEIPKYVYRIVSNFQDKLSLDFENLYKYTKNLALLEEKLGIVPVDNVLLELDYAEKIAIFLIDSSINEYGTNKNITKNSLEKDIFWITYVIKNIRESDNERKYTETCDRLEKELHELKLRLADKKVDKEAKKGNKEYYSLKEKLETLVRELTDIQSRLTISGEPIGEELLKSINEQYQMLDDLYNKLPDTVKSDKLLCNNLLSLFTNVKDLTKVVMNINKSVAPPKDEPTHTDSLGPSGTDSGRETGEHEEPPKTAPPSSVSTSTVDDDFEVIGERDSDSAYKKYGKILLVSSALSTIALTEMVLPFLVPGVIVANMYIIYKCELADKVNNILGKRIGAKKNKDGTWVNNLGEPLTLTNILPGLLKSIVINGEGKPKVVNELIAKVKKLATLIKTKEEKAEEKKINEAELKKMVAELYAVFDKSDLGIKEFCEREKLSPEVRAAFIEYVAEKMSKGGRSR